MSRGLLGLALVAIGTVVGTTTANAPVPDSQPRPIKVLVLEGTPRWEYRHLRNRFERKAEPKLYDPRFVLFSADPGAADGDPLSFRTLPIKKDLDSFDVVILGDCDPKSITKPGIEELSSFVIVRGGGLIVIAGENHTPHDWTGTALADLLPVAPGERAKPAERPTGYRPELTAAGRKHKVFRHGTGEGEVVWDDLPEMYWWSAGYTARPKTEILAVHPTAKDADGKPQALLLMHKFGKGKVAFVGFDETWRWSKETTQSWHIHFWREMLRSVASGG
jgi:uncharacterized membrane protein